jgi:hypothetical protein
MVSYKELAVFSLVLIAIITSLPYILFWGITHVLPVLAPLIVMFIWAFHPEVLYDYFSGVK